MLVFAAAALGAIGGSFLNALSFRFGTGRSVLKGRSRCMHCGKTLTAIDLIPILSFLFLRGRCRQCHTHISWQYPLVEALAALLSVGVYLTHPEPLLFAYWFLVWMTLLFTFVYDLKHMIIPWVCSITLAALAAFGFGVGFIPFTFWNVAAGPLLALPLFLLSLFSGGRWMGWGDSALELSLGWFLGFSMGLTSLMLGFWSGAIVGGGLLFLSRAWRRGHSRFTMNSEIPFAPFLIFGAAVVHFFHVDLFPYITALW